MKRIIMMLTVAAFLVAALTVSAVSAFAASPSEQNCTSQGGTFDRTQGQVSCQTTTQTVGKNPKFSSTTTTTTTGQGNDANKPTSGSSKKCDASNPGSSCPSGQGI
jgi:hypothetical protein